MTIARSIRVTGHVQGVFFREWTMQLANENEVSGWVRNRSDGSVEIYALGELDKMNHFTAQLHTGSPAARVAEVTVEPAEIEHVSGFMRRTTV